MWKNITAPDLRRLPRTQSQRAAQACDLSFSQTASKNNNHILIQDIRNFDTGSFQYESKPPSEVEHVEQGLGKRNMSNLNIIDMRKSMVSKDSRKQELILTELEQNEQLRVNLFRAEKTIQDLDVVCKSMHDKMIELLRLKKQQIDQYDQQKSQIKSKLKKINGNTINESQADPQMHKGSNQDKQNRAMSKGKKNTESQCSPMINALDHQQKRTSDIWKQCYNDLIEYINRYTQDISYLTEQYKLMENKNEEYKKSSSKAKKNEQNLIKILKESNCKLRRSEHMIQKAMEDIRERDHKIEEYQIENKDTKMKIIELRQQIDQLKRESKSISRESSSYKQIAKSLKAEADLLENKCKQLQAENENKDKLGEILKSSEEYLKSRVSALEQQLSDFRCFNDNLMEQYKKVSLKIEHNEEKLSEKYMTSELLYAQKVKQYEKFILTLKKQKQVCAQKYDHQMETIEAEMQKLCEIKSSLQKQLSNRSCIINELQAQIAQNESQRYHLQMELSTRLQQKERQVQYLEELRAISNQKNQELKMELQQLKSDMLTIIEQLKIKELEVERYKEVSDFSISPKFESLNKTKHNNAAEPNYFRRPNPQPKCNNAMDNIKDENAGQKALSSMINSGNEGLIWRKLKKDSGCEQNSLESFNKSQNKNIKGVEARKIEDSHNQWQQKQELENFSHPPRMNRTPFRQQVFLDQHMLDQEYDTQNYHEYGYGNGDDDRQHDNSLDMGMDMDMGVPHLQCVGDGYRQEKHKGRMGGDVKTRGDIKQVGTPKSRFSLQAFQNRIMMEEGARILMKFNKGMLR